MRLIGSGLLLFLVIYAIWSGCGDQSKVFISPSAFIAVVGGTGALLLMSHGRKTWSGFLRFITFRGKDLTEEERDGLGEFLQTGSRSALALGLFMDLCGTIIMLMNMSDPAAVGPGMAMSLLPLLYAIVLSEMVFVPMHKNLMQTIPKEKRRSLSKLGLYLVLLVNLLVFVRFSHIMLGMSEFKNPNRDQRIMELIKDKFGYDQNNEDEVIR